MPAIENEALATSGHGSTTTIRLHALQERLHPDVAYSTTNANGSQTHPPPTLTSIATELLANFLPTYEKTTTTPTTRETRTEATSASHTSWLPTFSPPSIENLVASSAEDLSDFRDATFDIFDDDDYLYGSPLAFDASENGLWNGRFVPPPPRPPFFMDEPILSDGLTTCDLCSWAMPTKSTFIFEGTIEKASELGWPLALIIVSILSALLGAIIMIMVVRCRRKKATSNRNETHVQWWSRNKRPNNNITSNNNNNHLRRSNIYTAHPASDSIRGLQQPTLSAASSLTAITAMGAVATTPTAPAATTSTLPSTSGQQQLQQQQQHNHSNHHHHHNFNHHNHTHHRHSIHKQHHHHNESMQHEYEFEHEYHQPQELQLQLQHQHSSSMSSTASSPSLPAVTTMKPIPMQLQHQPQQHTRRDCMASEEFEDDDEELELEQHQQHLRNGHSSRHWPKHSSTTAMVLASCS